MNSPSVVLVGVFVFPLESDGASLDFNTYMITLTPEKTYWFEVLKWMQAVLNPVLKCIVKGQKEVEF